MWHAALDPTSTPPPPHPHKHPCSSSSCGAAPRLTASSTPPPACCAPASRCGCLSAARTRSATWAGAAAACKAGGGERRRLGGEPTCWCCPAPAHRRQAQRCTRQLTPACAPCLPLPQEPGHWVEQAGPHFCVQPGGGQHCGPARHAVHRQRGARKGPRGLRHPAARLRPGWHCRLHSVRGVEWGDGVRGGGAERGRVE